MSEIRVNRIVNAAGSGAPQFPSGFSVATGYGITGGGNIVGTAATYSGAVKVTDNTSSTSTSTGALIVTGGLAVGGDVFVGAGMSIAGTLTYEDSTNIDSVGLITAQSGIRVPGGELTVGVAYSVGAAGVCTAAGFVGPLTGNVTGDVTGNVTGNASGSALNVTQAAQTAITSLGTLTGLTVSGDLFFDNGSDAGKDLRWDVSADALHFNDSVYAVFGTDSDSNILHDGANFYLTNTTGTLNIRPKASEMAIACVPDGAVSLYYDNSVKLATTNDGVSITGMTTTSAGMTFNGMLKEEVNIVANKLSAGTNIDVADGMVHYYSTNETTTATPNIRFNSSYTLNNKMATGQTVTVTTIYKPNNAGYYAQLQVDGSNVTEYWNGGAPDAANSAGIDVLTHTITKTADATFLVLSNVQNYTS